MITPFCTEMPATAMKPTAADTEKCNPANASAPIPPINANGTNVWNQGRTVPAKFRVCDANGVSIGTPGVVAGFYLIGTASGTSSTSMNTFGALRTRPPRGAVVLHAPSSDG